MNEPARTMSTSSRAVDYEALEATTSIENITKDELNREILRSLREDANLSHLQLCTVDDFVLGVEEGDYVPSRHTPYTGIYLLPSPRGRDERSELDTAT